MKLTTRLANLETKQPYAVHSREDRLFLVELLGRRDALFWPWRFGFVVSITEIHKRQREYLSGEQGLFAKADGKGEWKQAFERRQRLITAGFIRANYSSGQIQSVFLTALGEAVARGLVGDRLAGVNEFGPQAVYELLRRFGGLVRESTLFNCPSDGSPSDWEDMTELALPLLCAGLVKATSDGHGLVLYSRTDVQQTDVPVVDVDSDPGFDDRYVEAFDLERKVLSQTPSSDPNEVFIRVPSSLYWNAEAKS